MARLHFSAPYHKTDPVIRLPDFGFGERLDNLQDITARCLDETCFRSADCIIHTRRHTSVCHMAPSRLRIMYPGAKWRRRNT